MTDGSLGDWLAGEHDVTSLEKTRRAGVGAAAVRGRFRCPVERRDMRFASYPALTVQMLTKGRLTLAADFGHGRFEGTMTPGAFVVTPPGEPCAIGSEGDQDFDGFALSISPVLIERLLAPDDGGDVPDLNGLYRRSHRSDRLRVALDGLWSELAGRNGGGLLVQAAILSALASLLEIAAPRPAERRTGALSAAQLATACDAMDGDGDLSLTDIAAQIGVSPSHLSRAFRQSLGVTPSAWLLGRRIDRAKELLRDRRLSLSQIALDVGFAAQPQFTTAFRRATGLPPGVWRRTLA